MQYETSTKLYEKTISGFSYSTTNNRMELMGPIRALEDLTRPCKVVVTSDSQYVVNAFNEDWISRWQRMRFVGLKNADLWQRLIKAMEPHDVEWVWVKGHTGHIMNERCDSIATQELLRANSYLSN